MLKFRGSDDGPQSRQQAHGPTVIGWVAERQVSRSQWRKADYKTPDLSRWACVPKSTRLKLPFSLKDKKIR